MGKFEELRGEEFKSPKKTNIFRVFPRKGKVIIEFGRHSKNKKQVEVISSTWIKPEMLEYFLIAVYQAGIAYQTRYEEDIGFEIPEQEEKEEATE